MSVQRIKMNSYDSKIQNYYLLKSNKDIHKLSKTPHIELQRTFIIVLTDSDARDCKLKQSVFLPTQQQKHMVR